MTTLPPFLTDRRGFAARASRGPAAFTLVELLVVIAILAMLMALLVPTVMRARASAYTAKVKAEADMLHMALMTYKTEYGAFPPAEMGPVPGTTPPVSLADENTYKKHPVYRHLVKLFPRMEERPAAFAELAQLSPAQALVFWMRGFYPDQRYPLTNNGQPGSRRKLYDFDESRFYAASPYTPGTPQTFTPRSEVAATDLAHRYPVYFTGHTTSGLPYVYFDSRCYDDETVPDTTYLAVSRATGLSSRAAPYFTSDEEANPLWSQCHVAPDTFQIIASGQDGSYGPESAARGVAFPKTVTIEIQGTDTTIPAAADAVSAPGHQDNITNFASGGLLDATEALKNK
jgi:prepilin-type N-terminal cleavage/methylation domain-containing protein